MDCWANSGCVVENVATLECLVCIFETLINVAIRLAGIISFVMILVGGFRFVVAGDDPKKVEGAWHTITYAIMGLVLVILAWFILLFVKEFTGISSILNFKIGS